VSPTTSPGSRPASSGARVRAAVCTRLSRRPPVTRCAQPGPRSGVGGPRTDTRAATASPGEAGESLPAARTVPPGRRPRQPSDGANSTTASWRVARTPARSSPRTVASRTTRLPGAGSGLGTPSTRSRRVAVEPDRASSTSGEPVCSQARTAAQAAVDATAMSSPASTAATDVRRRCTAAARPPAVSAPATRATGARAGASAVTSQAAVAAGTSRRSRRRCRGAPSPAAAAAAVTPSPSRTAGSTARDRCPARRRADPPT
jgi:hypothetical protein